MNLRMADLNAMVREESDVAARFLLDLIRIPSLSGGESEAMEFVLEAFRPLADRVAPVQIPPDLPEDPEYSWPLAGLQYAGRFNVRAALNEEGKGRSLLLNTHLDVVPPSPRQNDAFNPTLENGVIRGRGACDAKGQVAALYLMFRVLARIDAPPPGRVVLHLVVEEENGGNGTLAMIRTGESADAALVLEPTGGKVVPAVRGAVWFRLTCEGRSGHSGSAGQTASALKLVVEAMERFESYHCDLLAISREVEYFEHFPNPMPITFGRLESGNWPTTVPDSALLEGILGFLPNTDRKQVMVQLQRRLEEGSPGLRDHSRLEFMYRHDGHSLPRQHELVQNLQACARDLNLTDELTGFPASCDSWFYSNLLNIPTVVYGPGQLQFAHSAEEQIEMAEIESAAAFLTRFVLSR